MARRAGSVALATGIVAVSVFGMLVGVLWGFGLKCDDSCGTPPPWRDDPDAWQWNAIGILAIAGLACALAFFAAVAPRWKIAASVALVAWAVVAGVFLQLFRDSGLTSHVERGWAGLGCAAGPRDCRPRSDRPRATAPAACVGDFLIGWKRS